MEAYASRFATLFAADCRAFGFWKGRVALYAILRALGIGANDEVILPGYTCVVVAGAIRRTGATPVYADIAPGTYNLDPASVAARLSARTRAIIAQHTYGIPADLDSLQEIAAAHRLELIEDCAHVLPGSQYRGRSLGSFGKASFFSSQWSKPYTTGLGGMALTQDRGLAARLASLHGEFSAPSRTRDLQLQVQYALYRALFRPRLYWMSQRSLHALSRLGVFVGSSEAAELTGGAPVDGCWRMGAFQQRAGLRQLERLDSQAARRRALSQYYADGLGLRERRFYGEHNGADVTLLRFPAQVDNKAQVLEAAARAGIELGSWFETPLHPLSMKDHGLMQYRPGSCPVAEAAAARVINLPLHDRVSRADASLILEFVCRADAAVRGGKEVYAEIR